MSEEKKDEFYQKLQEWMNENKKSGLRIYVMNQPESRKLEDVEVTDYSIKESDEEFYISRWKSLWNKILKK